MKRMGWVLAITVLAGLMMLCGIVALNLWHELALSRAASVRPAVTTNETTRDEGLADVSLLAALRLRLTEIEAENRSLRRNLRSMADVHRRALQASESNAWWGTSFTSYMARLQRTDPQRYAQVQARFAHLNLRAEEALARQTQFLLSLDTNAMYDDEAANHNDLLRVMSETWTLAETLRTNPLASATDDARVRLNDNLRVLDELFAQERATVLRQYGQSLGFDAASSAQFAADIEQLIDMTLVGHAYGGNPAAPAEAP